MSLKKQYLKTKPVCKVTFRLSPKEVSGAGHVHVVGEFNNWSTRQNPMKKLKDGAFTLTLDLETGRGYQFRYLVDNKNWINDPAADKYVPSGFSDCENAVVAV
jgi:1,4-alpha-glucan branching enzyme